MDGGGLRTYFFEPPISPSLLEFFIFYFTPENTRQNKAPSLEIRRTKSCSIPWKFQGQKPRPQKILHNFFLVTLGNSTSFLLNPLIPHTISLIPLEISYPQAPFLDFFWNSPMVAQKCQKKIASINFLHFWMFVTIKMSKPI